MPSADSPGLALSLLHWAMLPLGKLLLSPGSTFSLLSLVSALAIAASVLAVRRWRRGRAVRLRVLGRALFPRWLVRSASTRADLGFLLLNTFVTGALIGWGLLSAGPVSQQVQAAWVAWLGPAAAAPLAPWVAGAMQTVLLFLAYEFGYWLDHYLKHAVPMLWEFHRVHHTAETLSPLTVFRVHPVDTLVFINILVLMSGLTGGTASYWLGGASELTPFGTNALLLGFVFTTQHLQHSHLWVAFTGVWGRILASPAHHQIHHSADPAHFGKNLGSFLAVWDWLFRTLQVPQPTACRLRYGVEPEGDRPHSITGGLVTPFLRSARRLRGVLSLPSASGGVATARRPAPP